MKKKIKNWLEYIQSSGIPLRKIDDNGNPCSIGSGCLIDIHKRRFLISVFHVTKHSPKWAIQIKFNESVKKTEVYYPGVFNYLGDFEKVENSNTKIREVEFAFVEVPRDLECIFQHRNHLGKTLTERPRAIFKEIDVIDPDPSQTYGFAGDVKGSFITGRGLETEHNTYPGLKFDRTEGDYHCFKLPVEHPGHEAFRGCSGAPIIDLNRKVVSLVNHGCDQKNEIYGINLSKCIRTISQAIDKII